MGKCMSNAHTGHGGEGTSRRRAAGAFDAASPAIIPPPLPIACIAGDTGRDTLMPVCRQLTPCIEWHPNVLVLDLAGSERLLLGHDAAWRGDQRDAFTGMASSTATETTRWSRLAERLHHLLADASAPVPRVAIASSRTIAWLAAHAPGASWRAVAPRETARFLHPLPVEALLSVPDLAALPGAARAVAAVRQSGIATVGQLARLAPSALRARFGALGLALAQLAAGRDLTPLCAIAPAEWIGARLRLDPPRALEQLEVVLAPLAAFLARALHQRRLEAGELALVVCAEGLPPWRLRHSLGHATASRGALCDHACRLLEHLHAECGGARAAAPVSVGAVHLRVGGMRPAHPRQTAFWPSHGQRTARQLAQQLSGHAGHPCFWRAVLTAPSAALPEERYILQAHWQAGGAS